LGLDYDLSYLTNQFNDDASRLTMKKLNILCMDERTFSYLFIGYLCLMVAACGGNDGSVDHSPPSHYRIFTKSNDSKLHLAVDGIDDPKIQIIKGQLPTNFDDTVAWSISGESAFKVSSRYRWLGGDTLLAASENTSNVASSLADSGLNTSAVKWQIKSLPNGGCIIQNELLGSELALAVDTNTEPFKAVITSIDAENESQRWQIEAYADADIALVDRCR